MCKCTPNLRTPFCGKPGCEWPHPDEPFPQQDRVRPRLSWYVCHNCGWEAWVADSGRTSLGYGNEKCYHPDLHIHSNADGEMPKRLQVPK